jgi:ribosomal protein L18
MNRLTHKKINENRRANRVRTVIAGTTERPRLSVNVSNMHISAQIIDDTTGKTLAVCHDCWPKANRYNERTGQFGLVKILLAKLKKQK